jgi:hypothetical protein
VLADLVSRSWRSYLRFSVRGLIVLVLVIGAGLGWVVRSAHIQRDAVAAIEKDGGSFCYDWKWRNGVYVRGSQARTPGWLVDLIGVDFFGPVSDAALSASSTITDATTAHIGRLNRLRRLNLNQAPLTDAGLVHAKGLSELLYLDLSATAVTDAGLVHLRGLSKLCFLALRGIHVTDAGIKKLKQALRRATIYP